MISDRRRAKMEQVAAARLSQVCCAIEAVHHRHNIAAILRTCDALGVHFVHLVGHPRLKVGSGAARGAERWLDVSTHDAAASAMEALHARGFRVYVADLDGDAVLPEEIPVDGPVCLWFGAELIGVSEEARAAADGVVRLPMRGFAQSLNVSVAAAMALRPVADRVRARGPSALLPEAEREALLARWVAREEPHRRAIRRR